MINAYNKFELPGYWGTGKHASADGTVEPLTRAKPIRHHIRYGGYGGIGYHRNAPTSSSRCSVTSFLVELSRGIHILDGLMSNESDIRPDTIHGDTQAQSYPVFALAHLLGIQLMPRIRGIQGYEIPRAGGRCVPEHQCTVQRRDRLAAD